MKAKVWKLGWSGMEKVEISCEDLPKKVLKVDDWFSPTIGELCLNDKNKLDVVKKLSFQKATDMFKASVIYEFENSKKTEHQSHVHRVEVKKGHTFIFKGRVFVHQEPLDGGYITQMALNDTVTKYEYEDFK